MQPTRCLAAAIAVACLAAPACAQQVGGRYKVEGTNLNGTTYQGEAEIALTSDTTCAIKWITGPTESTGICMRRDDAFAAGYVMGNSVGLVIYKMLDNGRLEGSWTIAGQGGSGTEVLTPIP